jgi:hypothetical protein
VVATLPIDTHYITEEIFSLIPSTTTLTTTTTTTVAAPIKYIHCLSVEDYLTSSEKDYYGHTKGEDCKDCHYAPREDQDGYEDVEGETFATVDFML